MPVVSGTGSQPSVATVQTIVPAGQRVAPVEPARRVTAARSSDRAEVGPDDKRRRQHSDHSGDRGATLDLEV